MSNEFDKFDHLDTPCEHILVYYDEKPVETGRLRIVDGYGKLERICLLATYRNNGLGKKIDKALEKLAKDRGMTQVKLHGQTQAEGFYKILAIKLHQTSLWRMELKRLVDGTTDLTM